MNEPVLLIGGSGVTGRAIAKLLRARHPDLRLIIAGRDIEKARAFAATVDAEAISLDIEAPFSSLQDFDACAVVTLVKDATLEGLSWAQDRGIPYIGISSAAFEYGIDLVHALCRKQSAPVLVAGHWFAGAVTIAAIDLARSFEKVQSVTAGITIDKNVAGGGPASVADFERVSRSTKATLARINGVYVWEDQAQYRQPFRSVGGEMVVGGGAVSIDVAAIGAATSARNVRVLENWGVSHSYLSNGTPAEEISIEIEGLIEGHPRTKRMTLQIPNNTGSITAISVTIALERMIGLDGNSALEAGVYGPENLIAPGEFIDRLIQSGVCVDRMTI